MTPIAFQMYLQVNFVDFYFLGQSYMNFLKKNHQYLFDNFINQCACHINFLLWLCIAHMQNSSVSLRQSTVLCPILQTIS